MEKCCGFIIQNKGDVQNNQNKTDESHDEDMGKRTGRSIEVRKNICEKQFGFIWFEDGVVVCIMMFEVTDYVCR